MSWGGRWRTGAGGGGPVVLGGACTLLVSPFDAAGRVDAESFDRLVDHHLSSGAQGLFAVCGTGEMAALTLAERLGLARAAARRAGGAVPVLATANLEADPAAQGEEVAAMAATGVDAVVLVPPRRHPGEPGALGDYLHGLAARSGLPVLLYEWPGSNPSDIPPAVFARLVATAGVVGLKDTTCTLPGIAAKIAAAPGAAVFQANTPLLPEALRLGARGCMTIASAARPGLFVRLVAAVAAGRDAETAALHREAVHLDALLGPCHPAAAKWLLQRAGLIADCRTRLGRAPGQADLAALATF